MPQTRSQTRKNKIKNSVQTVPIVHPEGWTRKFQYSSFGCYCGQSCPCCRALVGDTFGACPICMKDKQNYNLPK